jgi:hypothetical protein
VWTSFVSIRQFWYTRVELVCLLLWGLFPSQNWVFLFLFLCVSVGWNDEGDTAAIVRFDSSVFSITALSEVVLFYFFISEHSLLCSLFIAVHVNIFLQLVALVQLVWRCISLPVICVY